MIVMALGRFPLGSVKVSFANFSATTALSKLNYSTKDYNVKRIFSQYIAKYMALKI